MNGGELTDQKQQKSFGDWIVINFVKFQNELQHVSIYLCNLSWLPVSPSFESPALRVKAGAEVSYFSLFYSRFCAMIFIFRGIQHHQIQHRRIWTSPSPFLYNQRSCCHEDTGPVQEARLLRLRSKYLEPDSSSHQEPSFCSGFSQSSKDLFVFRDHLDTVMHYRSHCCR